MLDWVHICCAVLVGGLILNTWFFVRVLHPLRKVMIQSQQLAKGDFQALEQATGGIREIETLRRSLLGMSRHIRHGQVQRQAYVEALTSGQEAERGRLAHELHDDTIQGLIAIGQSIDLAQVFMERDPKQLSTMLKSARQQVSTTVNSLRYLIGDLLPPALEELGLATALHTLAERFTGGALSVTVHGAERRLEESLELTLFRCTQEALSNARRHGNATSVQVGLYYEEEGVRLTVKDNGDGFAVPDDISELLAHSHYGLFSIQERVKKRKGSVTILSNMGKGTTVEIKIPYPQQEHPQGTVRDPVCSMRLEPHQVYGSVEYEGTRYYFCCPVCQGSFQSDPEAYLVNTKGEFKDMMTVSGLHIG